MGSKSKKEIDGLTPIGEEKVEFGGELNFTSINWPSPINIIKSALNKNIILLIINTLRK